MPALRYLFLDQMSQSISCLKDINKETDTILIVETKEDFTHVKHHKKKIAFWISVMRHFSLELQKQKYKIKYLKIDDPDNKNTLENILMKEAQKAQAKTIIMTEPSDYAQHQRMIKLKASSAIPIEIREDDRFLSNRMFFAEWAKDKKQLRMEFFYREMRKKYDILMQGTKPEGGKWNYDSDNRKPPTKGLDIPAPYKESIDKVTKEALEVVKKNFNDHFGDLEPFFFAVTRDQALQVLHQFIEERLINFGTYQDAMIEGEPWMYHSHISFYLNCGLLLPLECIKAAESAYQNKKAPLNAVEGFIRQILGWREFIKGIYQYKMPSYENENFLDASMPLPDFYWTGKTKMNCLKQCVNETKENAYAHHIQRLMVLGNFALLSGLNPSDVNEWYHIVYADAYQWVELPNVTGMILFADGGVLGSKPYAASGAYINKMSNYCKNCTYKVNEKTGDEACPFNYLYWDFLNRNHDKLRTNQRLAMIYKVLEKMDPEKKKHIIENSKTFLNRLTKNELI